MILPTLIFLTLKINLNFYANSNLNFNQNHNLNHNPDQYQLRHIKNALTERNGNDLCVRKIEFGSAQS